MITSSTKLTSQDVAAHYDELDPFYRDLWGEHVHHGLWLTGRETPEHAVEQLVTHVVDALGLSDSAEVCDVGCGYGGTSRYLAFTRNAQVTGLTVSPTQYSLALEKNEGRENPTYRLEDWQTNGLDSDAFDGLVSIECIAHVEEKQLFFDQVHRVLRPGKRAVITAWLSKERPGGWETKHLLEPICREGRLLGMGTELEYTALIERAGLRLVEYDDLSDKVSKTWSVITRRVLWALLTSPKVWRFLLLRESSHSIFMLTVARLVAAFRTGAMRYGFFIMEKPAQSSSGLRCEASQFPASTAQVDAVN